MSIHLRPYQFELKSSVAFQWSLGKRVVVMRLDTSGGKTAIFAQIINEHKGHSCLIAHRDSILSAISLALAKCGVRHNIIADAKTVRAIADRQIKKLGKSFFDPGARCTVASVDTIIRRKGLEAWAAQITLWVIDEGHHVVEGNKWWKAIQKFTNKECRGLLPTATPKRADGQGLGTKALGGHGVAEAMVEGPPLRWLIEEGYICDYDVISADSHLTELLGEVGKSGDWSQAQIKVGVDGSPIIGDVVKTYQALNSGHYEGYGPQPYRTGIVFAPDLDTANKMLMEYRRRGIIAELITGETDVGVRSTIFDGLENGTIHIVIAVDIVSEGTDIPALQLGIFARPTASLGVYMQQFGRILRAIYAPGFDLSTREGRLAAIAASIKPKAIIIDHVGNFMRHGPPDRPRKWTLASLNARGGPSDTIPMRVCLNPKCAHPYHKFLLKCPKCGRAAPPPVIRASATMVEGDMTMLDPAVLEAMRGMVDEALISVDEYRMSLAAKGVPRIGQMAHAKSWDEKLKLRHAVQTAMDRFGGIYHAQGLSDNEIQRLFWYKYGTDVFTAQTLGIEDSAALLSKLALDDGSI